MTQSRDFGLAKAVGTRPSLMRYELPLDDAWMRRTSERVARTHGKRPGRDWIRADAIEAQADDDVWVTRLELRPLDDACTRFVSKTFLPDAFARVDLVANVIRLYDRLAEVCGRPFRIVFKGGVMQRLVLLEFWHDLPLAARRKAVAYLTEHKAVNVSDMDFEILPDAGARRSASEKHKLIALQYAVLLWLQAHLARQLQEKKQEGMLYTQWDRAAGEAELRADLQRAVDALEPSHPMHGATVDRVVLGGRVDAPPKGYTTRQGRPAPAPRRNLFVFPCEEEGTCVAPATQVFAELGVGGVPTEVVGDDVYSTCNYYINEGAEKVRPHELRPLFHLARIKHTFVLYYRTKRGEKRCDRLAGELIDLSQGDPADEGVAWMHDALKGEQQEYRDYPIVGVKGVGLRSYTVAHFLMDYMLILHHSAVPPWEVPKFAKRLVRYVNFLLVHVFSADVPGTRDHKLRALRALVEYTRTPPETALRTGCAPVDAFAALERRSYARGAREYLRVLHTHLRTLVELAAAPPAWETRTLVPSHVWHTDHL